MRLFKSHPFKSPQFSALWQQTMPMLIGLFAIMGSQLVDGAFIGQLGARELAVVGFSIPIYQLIIGIQVGLGVATTASISNALGENKRLYAKYLGTIVLFIGAVSITVLVLVLWYFQESTALYLGADRSLLSLLRSYWFPWLFSCWLGAILYFGYSICRSHGETVIPGKVMVITSILNIGLDPLFIFTLDMGLAGAAWATCAAFIIGNFIIFQMIIRRKYIAILCDVRQAKQGIVGIVKFTIPAMLSQFIPPISAMIVTIIIASFGDVAIGAWGLASRIEYISIILILALTMAMPPMIGMFRGKHQIDEIYELVKVAIGTILFCQTILALIIFCFANPITTLLTNDTGVEWLLHQYLWLVPISYGALGVCMICVSACNAMGMPTSALLISIIRLFGCYLPLIWIGAQQLGLLGVFIGASLGNILSGIAGWLMFLQQYPRLAEKTRLAQKTRMAQRS